MVVGTGESPFPLDSYLLMFSFLCGWAVLKPLSLQGGPAVPFCHGDAAGHPPACFLSIRVVLQAFQQDAQAFLQNYFQQFVKKLGRSAAMEPKLRLPMRDNIII